MGDGVVLFLQKKIFAKKNKISGKGGGGSRDGLFLSEPSPAPDFLNVRENILIYPTPSPHSGYLTS